MIANVNSLTILAAFQLPEMEGRMEGRVGRILARLGLLHGCRAAREL
jgi:hypothetical protein